MSTTDGRPSDPVAAHADRICAHMNDDHADANLAYARVLCGVAGATAARMIAVDRDGFTLAIEHDALTAERRVAFPAVATGPDDVRRFLVELLRAVRP